MVREWLTLQRTLPAAPIPEACFTLHVPVGD